MQANQLASAIDHAGCITNFTENHASKFFFSRLKRDVSVIKKVCQENIPFVKQIHITYVFLKA